MLAPQAIGGISEVSEAAPRGGQRSWRRDCAGQRRGGSCFPEHDAGYAFRRREAIARDNAIAAGADPTTLKTIEREDLPLAYLPGNAVRARVRVVGDIGTLAHPQNASRPIRSALLRAHTWNASR